MDETAVGAPCRSAFGIGESGCRSINLWAIRQWSAIFLGKPRIGFHHLAGVDSLCSLDGKKGDPMAAYFVFTIGACLFAAAALAYDSYAERRERRAKKHHNR